MPWPDLSGQVALVTGGTSGLGLAAGLALARHGAQVVLTYKWGSRTDEEVLRDFEVQGGPAPMILAADAGDVSDTEQAVREITAKFGGVDIFISNVCVVPLGGSLDAFRRRDVVRSMRYNVWATREYVDRLQEIAGRPPRRLIAMSSDGGDHHYPRYDYVGMSKAGLEALIRDIHQTRGITCFALRTRQVSTQGFEEMFPKDVRDLLTGWFTEFAIEPASVGKAIVALASSAMDSVSGQTLVLDKGAAFMDNLLTTTPDLLATSTVASATA